MTIKIPFLNSLFYLNCYFKVCKFRCPNASLRKLLRSFMVIVWFSIYWHHFKKNITTPSFPCSKHFRRFRRRHFQSCQFGRFRPNRATLPSDCFQLRQFSTRTGSPSISVTRKWKELCKMRSKNGCIMRRSKRLDTIRSMERFVFCT